MDMAGSSRLHAAEAGPSVRGRPASAVGQGLRSGTADTAPGPPGCLVAFRRAWHARQAAETLRSLSGSAKRASLGPGTALPSTQEDSLKTSEDDKRESFVMEIKPIAKLLVLKTQAK
jgi:hypothetical protein